MSDFTFTSAAQCELCGNHLSSSDEDCDHDGTPVDTYVFRRLSGGRETMKGVECAESYKWHKLEEKVGDDWIAYQFIGSRSHVEGMLSEPMWDGVSDLPIRSMATHAPDDVGAED